MNPSKQRIVTFSLLFLLNVFLFSCGSLKKYPAKDRAWALPEIEAFEKLDAASDYPANSILFVGSSSIRLWKTLKQDMEPYPIIQRGYGGAHFRDLIFFTERILSDHQIQMLVCFVANDISGSPQDERPKQVLKLFKFFVKQVREKHPQIPILQIAITPTKSRWGKWSEIDKVNQLFKTYCEKTKNVYFVNTVPAFLDEKGMPKPEWFVSDQLHLNKKGYGVWSSLIRTAIEEQLTKESI